MHHSTGGNVLNADKMFIHPLIWRSTSIRRICRSTLRAGLRIVQCCWTSLANSGCYRWHERTAQYSSMGGNGFCSNGTCLVYRLWKSFFCSLGVSQYRTSQQQTFDDWLVSSETTYLGQPWWLWWRSRWIEGRYSLLDWHVRNAVRLRNEDDDILLIVWNVDIFDLRPTEESLAIKATDRKWRALNKEQERLQDSCTWNFSRSWCLSRSISFLGSCWVCRKREVCSALTDNSDVLTLHRQTAPRPP